MSETCRVIYHNWYIKLVPLVILIYDARSHIHQIHNWNTRFRRLVGSWRH